MNLTCMLVLTTMFISVSSNLPTTSYVKMIDIWLLASLFVPFIEVILHTYMDLLRNVNDREINHHGRVHKVAGVNETNDVVARQAWLKKAAEKRARKLKICQQVSKIYVPLVASVFIIGWWMLGIFNYYYH